MRRFLAALLVAAGGVTACSPPAPDTIGVSPTTPPTAQPSTAPTTTAEAAPEGDATTPQVALEQLAHALGTDDFAEIERLVGGPLVQLAEVQRIDSRIRRRREPVPAVDATASDLVVTSEEGNRAVATGRIERTTGTGDTSRTETYDGPFELRRAGDVWRVVDAMYEGRPVAGGPVALELAQRGLVVELRGVVDAGDATYAVFFLRDTVGGRRQVIGFVGAALTRDGAALTERRGVLVPDRAGTDGYAVFDRGAGRVSRVAITLNDGPQPLEFVFNL